MMNRLFFLKQLEGKSFVNIVYNAVHEFDRAENFETWLTEEIDEKMTKELQALMPTAQQD